MLVGFFWTATYAVWYTQSGRLDIYWWLLSNISIVNPVQNYTKHHYVLAGWLARAWWNTFRAKGTLFHFHLWPKPTLETSQVEFLLNGKIRHVQWNNAATAIWHSWLFAIRHRLATKCENIPLQKCANILFYTKNLPVTHSTLLYVQVKCLDWNLDLQIVSSY